MTISLHIKPYLVKVAMKGEESKLPKNLSTWFMDLPIGHHTTFKEISKGDGAPSICLWQAFNYACRGRTSIVLKGNSAGGGHTLSPFFILGGGEVLG